VFSVRKLFYKLKEILINLKSHRLKKSNRVNLRRKKKLLRGSERSYFFTENLEVNIFKVEYVIKRLLHDDKSEINQEILSVVLVKYKYTIWSQE